MRQQNHFVLWKRSMCLSFILFASVLNSALISQCNTTPGEISGVIFNDADFDGVLGSTDTNLSNVLVSAYDANGVKVAEELSTTAGYTLAGLLDGEIYRLEFTYATSYKPSFSSVGDNIRFVTSPVCDVVLGLQKSGDYCEEEPNLAVTCFVRGGASEWTNLETVVGIERSFNLQSSPFPINSKSETGSVWGLAWRQRSQELFTSAFVKQDAALTSLGAGAIFTTQFSASGNAAFNLFVDVTDHGVDVGTLAETDPGECAYGAQAGKYGLGALTLSADESVLYTVNLFRKSLVIIPVNNPAGLTEIAIPDPGCADGDYAPFALTEENGLIYVGVTCTGETAQVESASSANVFEYDPSTSAFDLVFSTNYIKGYWKDDQEERTEIAHWLTDLDFTDEGNMILSLSDRIGHIHCTDSGRTDQQFPDILLVWNDNGTWRLEDNGQAGTLTGTGVGNGEGPGGGEFFGDDFWSNNAEVHPEIALGSIFVLPGTGEVVASVYDPATESYSGGLHRYTTSSGNLVGANELYVHTFDPYFGKATGFGDIDAMCGTIPISIGNFVWDDANGDGQQDPGESPITGLTISIYNESCTKVGETVTDQNGNYYFNDSNVDLNGDGVMDGLANESTYYIVVDDSNILPANARFSFNGSDYDVTSIRSANANTTTDSNASLDNDSCSGFFGMPVVEVVTGGPGENDYNFDIGFTSNFVFDLALIKTVREDTLVRIGDKVGFEITVYNQGSVAAEDIVVSEYLNSGYIFNSDDNPEWQEDDNGSLRARIRGPIEPLGSETLYIELEISPDATLSSLVNIAEISFAKDIFGDEPTDIDSHPDSDPFNDVGGVPNAPFSDNVIDDDGTIDEDDHDPAVVRFMDLALKKIIKNPQENYSIGDHVCFDIVIYNQGPISAGKIEVVDYIPAGLDLASGPNTGWVAHNDSLATYVIQETLESGQTDTVDICFQISEGFTGDNIVNYAEISYMETVDGDVGKDLDSYPNSNRLDDAGGVPGTPTDNEIFGRGVSDEDDHDPASLRARTFDLALIKTATRTFVEPGDNVVFRITITNQGTSVADNIVITDYIPAGLSLNDNDWTMGSGNTASITLNAGDELPVLGLFFGETVTVPITLRVDDDVSSLQMTNGAEISGATDEVGNDMTDEDIDSTADTNPNNDVGGTIGTPEDDHIDDDGMDTDGDGITDEDDSDSASVFLITSEIVSTCTCTTNGLNGEDDVFEDCFTIFGPPGQTWSITSNTGLTAGDIVEGPDGEYNFCGTFTNDTAYSIRVNNGQGSNVDFTNSCTPYEEIEIEGPFAICIGSEVTYNIVNPIPGAVYEWSVCATNDVSIWGPSQGTSIQVVGDNITPANMTCEISVDIVSPGSKCTAPGVHQVQVGNPGTSMTCIGEINTSLNQDCEYIVTPELLLASGDVPPNVSLTVILSETHGGEPFDSNVLTGEHVGKKIIAKLMDGCSGNSCWTTITVEDKSPPIIDCGEPYEVKCYNLRDFEPTITENCSFPVELVLTDAIDIKECDGTYIKTIRRSYIATDKEGFSSDECEVEVRVKGVDIYNDVLCPDNWLLADERALTCSNYPLDANGFPDPAATGVPYIQQGGKQIPLYPVGEDFLCKLAVTYTDQVTVDSDCKQKIIREWVIFEACDGSSNVRRCPQTIEIHDPIAPSITCPHPIYMDNQGYSCGVDVFIPMPEAEDNCSADIHFELRWRDVDNPDNFGFVPDFEGEELTLSPGVYQMTFTALDGCHATAECSVQYTIEDVAPPVAICDQHTIVSLASDAGGQTHIPATTFDSGSYDGCKLSRVLARRMDTNCECEPPSFNRYTYLGEIDGHHYYLSDDEFIAPKAFNMAEALGGNVVKLESNGEGESLRALVDKVYPGGDYLIGLSDANHSGVYEWQDGTIVDNNIWPGFPDIVLRNTLEENGVESTYASLFGAADSAFDEEATFSTSSPEFPTALAQPSSATGLPFDINGLYKIDITESNIHFTLLPDNSDPFWVNQFGVFPAGKFDRYYLTFSEPHGIVGGTSSNGSVNLRVDSDFVVVVELSAGYDFNPGIKFQIDLQKNNGDYIMTTNGGTGWIEFDGVLTEKKFVLELDDPCGFSDYVPFCCSDASSTDPLMVVLRAIDKCGNYNDCMVEAIVQDKYPPITQCPENVTIDCDYNYDLEDLSEFGEPTVFDQCEFNLEEEVRPDINSCGVGTIIREFTSSDATGRSSCIQIITIEKDDLFDFDDIIMPEPYETETCVLDELSPDILPSEFVPQYENGAEGVCDLVGFSYEDQIFPFADGNACLKVLRTWTYIDWCQMVNGLPKSIEFVQVIKVTNAIAPVVVLDESDPLEVCTIDTECDEALVELVATATDDCTPPQNLYTEFQIDYNNDGSIDSTRVSSGATINATDFYPVGNHTIFYTFEDRCGNKETVQQSFIVKNCKAPTAACIDGLSVALVKMDLDNDNVPETPMAVLWANDFDASSVHPCGYDITFSFTPDTTDTSLELNCNDLGQNTIEVYVTDIFGNQSFCQTTLLVTDPTECCPTSKECIIPPETPIAPTGCFADTSPDEIGGMPTVDPDCFCDDFEFEYTDVTSTDANGCLAIVRTWTAIARCGTPDTCVFEQEITLMNAAPPQIRCMTDVLDAMSSPDNDDCEAFVQLNVPQVGGRCNDGIVITHDSEFADDVDGENASGTYPVGTTEVTYTATDACGNTGQCTVTVNVLDGTPPICNVNDITVNLTNTGEVTIDFADLNNGSMDVCGDRLIREISQTTFTCDDRIRGGVDVIVTLTDTAGNSTTCVANVIVMAMNEPLCVAQDITIRVDEDGNANIRPGAIGSMSSDGCSELGVDLEIDDNMFTCDDLGENIVILTVTDEQGNSAQCSSTVTVEDDIAPECITRDVEVTLNDNGVSVVLPIQVAGQSQDNCGIDNITLSQPLFDCSDLGSNIVSVTVTDESGNANTTRCAATITVVDDTAPICDAADITIQLDDDGTSSISGAEAAVNSTDNCSIVDINVFPENYFCNDIGIRTYTLTVTDQSGNSSECMGQVTVEGDGMPVLTCPDDVTINCDRRINPLSQFGSAVLDSDGCASLEEDAVFNVNTCNIGQITRTFTASSGAQATVECTQTIRINGPQNPLVESMITWPDESLIVEGCTSIDPDELGRPDVDVTDVDCVNLGIDFVDENTSQPGECPANINRTWTVIDSCQLMRGSDNGIFTFTQSITLNDDTAPVITINQNIVVDLQEGECESDLGRVFATITDCDPNPVVTNDSEFATNNNSQNIGGVYPIGVHVVTITATDFCGNSSEVEVTITINGDVDAVDYECKKIIRQIESNGQIEIGITEVSCVTGCNVDIVASYSNVNINDNVRTYTCQNLGTGCGGNDQCVDIYFWQNGEVIDSCRNILVTLQDPAGFCAQAASSQASISGKIFTEQGDGIMNTMVRLDGSGLEENMTGEAGTYAFPNMPVGGQYVISPEKDDDHNNGVSTLDLILIQKHILGLDRFDSPYKYIAADANNSKDVTVADLVELRKLILGIYAELPDNTSWRMVDAAYDFRDEDNPLLEAFPEVYDILDLERDMYVNFVGVKVGDLNYSARVNQFGNTEIRSVENLKFEMDMVDVSDDIVQVDFYSANFNNINGFQFTLDFDVSQIFFQDIQAANLDITSQHIGVQEVENGKVTFSYHDRDAMSLTQNQKLFSLRFMKMDTDATLEGISFTSEITRAEAYRNNDILGVAIDNNVQSDYSDVILYQNVPNPWSINTKVEFYLPKSMDINVNFFDITGKLLKEVSGEYQKGRHSLNVDRDDFKTSGLIYYELITPDNKYTKKMILLN